MSRAPLSAAAEGAARLICLPNQALRPPGGGRSWWWARRRCGAMGDPSIWLDPAHHRPDDQVAVMPGGDRRVAARVLAGAAMSVSELLGRPVSYEEPSAAITGASDGAGVALTPRPSPVSNQRPSVYAQERDGNVTARPGVAEPRAAARRYYIIGARGTGLLRLGWWAWAPARSCRVTDTLPGLFVFAPRPWQRLERVRLPRTANGNGRRRTSPRPTTAHGYAAVGETVV